MSTTYLYFRAAILAAALCFVPVSVRAQGLAIGNGANATGAPAIAIGDQVLFSANATATDTIAIGTGATASGVGATAIGPSIGLAGVLASGFASTAVGPNARATASGSMSMGMNSQANGFNSVAVGAGAQAQSSGGIAIGSTANSASANSIAVGAGAQAQSSGGIAIGLSANSVSANSIAIGAGAVAQSSVALGVGAQALGATSTAIGDNAVVQAGAANAVAIGNGSVATQSNTLSVGSVGNERRVTNVAAGTAGTDAVNVNQLNAVAIGGAGPQVDALTSRMGAVESRVDDLTRNAYRGIAGVAALSGAMPMSPGRISVNIGAATYQGYSALGAQVGYLAPGGGVNFSGGMSQSAGKPVGRVSVGFTF